MSNFLQIVMEAKGKKPIKFDTKDADDYTKEEGDGEEDIESEEDTSDNEEEQDTEESDDDGSTKDDLEEESEEDDTEPTNYTEDEEEFSDDEQFDEGEESEDDLATDYTDDGDDSNTDSEGEDGGEDSATDYTSDDSNDEPSMSEDDGSDGDMSEEEEEGPSSEDRKNKALLDDLMKLKEIVQGFINKLTSIDVDNIQKVELIGQINKNLTQLSTQIHNYIVYKFQHESYVRNLYFYNYSVEAVNININMLKKISKMDDNK